MLEREWRFYLADMIDFAEKVLSYTAGLTQAEFATMGMNYDATLRNLELIGEAASYIPDKIRQKNPQIPWQLINATRKRIALQYLGIDNDTLWNIIQTDIPQLLPQLHQLRDSLAPTP